MTSTAIGPPGSFLAAWRIILVDSNTSKIYNIETDGTLIDSFPSPSSGVIEWGISYAPDDTLWVLSDAIAFHIENNGDYIGEIDVEAIVPGINATGIAYDPSDGTLWITAHNYDKIYNIESDGSAVISVIDKTDFDPGAQFMTGVSVALNNTLWVTDSISNRVYNIEKDGSLIFLPLIY